VIHLQEPWLVYFGIEDEAWDSLEKALTDIRDAAGDGPTLVLHTYFGDAAPVIDRLRALPVDVVGVDLVETDPEALGSNWDKGLLAGCLDGRRSLAEPTDRVVTVVRRAAERTATPSLFVSSNSDLELLPRDIARSKVTRLGEVRDGLREELS
jgi:methionine synthase II (cobalamin-independent)